MHLYFFYSGLVKPLRSCTTNRFEQEVGGTFQANIQTFVPEMAVRRTIFLNDMMHILDQKENLKQSLQRQLRIPYTDPIFGTFWYHKKTKKNKIVICSIYSYHHVSLYWNFLCTSIIRHFADTLWNLFSLFLFFTSAIVCFGFLLCLLINKCLLPSHKFPQLDNPAHLSR